MESRRGLPCDLCGEWIPVPSERTVGDPRSGYPVLWGVFCTDCIPDTEKKTRHTLDAGAEADRRYQGDMFHAGEW